MRGVGRTPLSVYSSEVVEQKFHSRRLCISRVQLFVDCHTQRDILLPPDSSFSVRNVESEALCSTHVCPQPPFSLSFRREGVHFDALKAVQWLWWQPSCPEEHDTIFSPSLNLPAKRWKKRRRKESTALSLNSKKRSRHRSCIKVLLNLGKSRRGDFWPRGESSDMCMCSCGVYVDKLIGGVSWIIAFRFLTVVWQDYTHRAGLNIGRVGDRKFWRDAPVIMEEGKVLKKS